MIRHRKPPSPPWRGFLKNHVKDIVAIDFFVMPPVRNQVLFVFLMLAPERRRILRFDVTANATAEWTAQQIVEAFPWDDAPRYLLRDRDGIYGAYFRYYHRWRTHQSLEMDAPDPRPVQSSEDGRVIEIPEVGGIHQQYERIAA